MINVININYLYKNLIFSNIIDYNNKVYYNDIRSALLNNKIERRLNRMSCFYKLKGRREGK